MTRALLILGAGGHGREVLAAVEAMGQAGASLGSVRGFLDDSPALVGTEVAGWPVLGSLRTGAAQGEGVILGVGYPEMKLRVLRQLGNEEIECPVVIHPEAGVGPRVQLGRGSLVQAGAVLTADIQVGAFVTVNLGATISHDCVLGDYATVSPGASVGGTVTLGEGAFIGIGASVVQGVRIGAWSVVGAGAVVLEDVPANTVVVGVPARVLRTRPDGWQDG